MQEISDTHPQAFSQDEPVSSSINHASISPSKAASHPSQLASHASQHCEDSTLRLGPAAIQLLLLVILLYAAHRQYPQLHPGFLVACASVFVLLLVRNSWVSGISCEPSTFSVLVLVITSLMCKNRQQRGMMVTEHLQQTGQHSKHSSRHGNIPVSLEHPT